MPKGIALPKVTMPAAPYLVVCMCVCASDVYVYHHIGRPLDPRTHVSAAAVPGPVGVHRDRDTKK